MCSQDFKNNSSEIPSSYNTDRKPEAADIFRGRKLEGMPFIAISEKEMVELRRHECTERALGNDRFVEKLKDKDNID